MFFLVKQLYLKKLYFSPIFIFFCIFSRKKEQFELFRIEKFKLFFLFINCYDNFKRARNWSAFACPMTLSKSRV